MTLDINLGLKFLTLCHNVFQPLKGIMMEFPYKRLGLFLFWVTPLFTPFSSNRYHRGLNKAEHKSPNKLFPLFCNGWR